jgi:hypothetical protein
VERAGGSGLIQKIAESRPGYLPRPGLQPFQYHYTEGALPRHQIEWQWPLHRRSRPAIALSSCRLRRRSWSDSLESSPLKLCQFDTAEQSSLWRLFPKQPLLSDLTCGKRTIALQIFEKCYCHNTQ